MRWKENGKGKDSEGDEDFDKNAIDTTIRNIRRIRILRILRRIRIFMILSVIMLMTALIKEIKIVVMIWFTIKCMYLHVFISICMS